MRLVVALGLVACSGSSPPDTPIDAAVDAAPFDSFPSTRCTRCPAPGEIQNRGNGPTKLVEASGIVASRAQPGVIYGHNDSGDAARIIAFDDHGAELATLQITGATNVDWEDIAIGPCGNTSCIYIGDIGDNSTNRLTKTVYRVPEPTLAIGQAPATMMVASEAFPFSYPVADGLHNAETLLVHPISGDIYVVTKEDVGKPSTVYKFPQPLTAGVSVTLTKVTTLPFPSGQQPDVSGGDIDPCGGAVLLRLGSAALYELDAPDGQPFDDAFSVLPRILPIAIEANGEAISWDANGAGYFTLSEGGAQPLHYVACP